MCWAGRQIEPDVQDRLPADMKLDSLETSAEKRMLNKLLAIMDDASHPLHTVIMTQRSQFSDRLLFPRCKIIICKHTKKETFPHHHGRQIVVEPVSSLAVVFSPSSDVISNSQDFPVVTFFYWTLHASLFCNEQLQAFFILQSKYVALITLCLTCLKHHRMRMKHTK